MQDLAPKCVGKASAFYTNAMVVGTMLGTSGMGVISQYYGFKAPLLLCFVAVLMPLAALIYFEKVYLIKRERQVEQHLNRIGR